jgi:hypothetical protein
MVAANPTRAVNWPKLLCALVAGLYFLWCAWDVKRWHLIDGANLIIHEAGHLIFSPLGEFLMIAGGSLMQVIMPAAFVFYFYRNDKAYSAALVCLWVGESLLNVSVYAGDSIARQLPLLGGQDTIHDWNYLLTRMGMLSATPKIAALIRLAGTLVILAGIFWAIRESLRSGRLQEDYSC